MSAQYSGLKELRAKKECFSKTLLFEQSFQMQRLIQIGLTLQAKELKLLKASNLAVTTYENAFWKGKFH